MAEAAKKADKAAAEGIVKIKKGNKNAVIIEMNSETDFVAKNDSFLELSDNILNLIFENNIKTMDQLLETEMNGSKVKEIIAEQVAKIGENVKVRRFENIEISDNETVGSYIHAGGEIGVLLKVKLSDDSKKNNPDLKELVKDICMQIAAASPKYVNPEDVSEEDLNTEREIYKKQMLNEGKPENIVDRIVEGKIRKYYEQVCLNKQFFVKDNDKQIEKVVKETASKIGCDIEIVNFIRYKVGEGIVIEKKDFADEIKEQLDQAKS
jgi:elongation factor Ts